MGYLAGSRALLSQYLQAHPASRTEGMAVEQEREELRVALVTAQESAAIQILLEVCVKTPQDRVCFQTASGTCYSIFSSSKDWERKRFGNTRN